MKFGTAIVLALLVLTGLLLAQLPDEHPAPIDSVHSDSLALWLDTMAVFPDSVAQTTTRSGWLYPLGLIVVTCAGYLLLFTSRSH